MKQVTAGVLFCLPLAIAVISNPPGWNAIGFAVAAAFALAVCYLAAVLFTGDAAWDDIHRVARLLAERDLRAGALPEEGALAAANREGRGQVGYLYRVLREAHLELSDLAGQAHRSAHVVGNASESLASGGAHLSERTQQQASMLEHAAAAMEQLSSTVKQNAESCRHASELAAGAVVVARNGASTAENAVKTMDRIDAGSRRIVDIISVIESLSFQTNILALNAAVEAARAGEHGRGFAVVAEEVRGLARRSAEAAREIHTVIADSVSDVSNGTRLVHEAGRIIDEIAGKAEEVNELIGIIAIASREQASGVDGINGALSQLQGATQANAAAVQGAARAAAELGQAAARLLEVAGRFRIDEPQARLARRGMPPLSR